MLSDSTKLSDDELACWLAFDRMEGIGLGPNKILQIYDRMQSMVSAWKAPGQAYRDLLRWDSKHISQFLAKRQEMDPEKLLAELRASEIEAWAFADPRYPNLLKHIHDPPAVLYIKGNVRDSDFVHAVGIVGTRRPTTYGQRIAKDVSRELSAYGATVISGMAIGIDSICHWGAIEGGGRTVAVLACGPDYCYPSSNRKLYKSILDNDRGIIISEYFPGTTPETWRFPARNRIISGLSKGLVVVEAGETSGSLITAKLAFEQSRQVFAFPGRIDSEMSRGTHQLVKDLRASLVTSHLDIVKHLDWVTAGIVRDIPTVIELYGREREVYELLSAEPVHFDVLCERTGMPAGEMSATVTMLELAGVALRHPGDWFSLVRAGFAPMQTPTLPTMSDD